MASSLPIPSATAVYRDIDEGGVLFCTRTEIYFGVNQVGALVWRALVDGVPSLDPLVAGLKETFSEVPAEQIEEDVREFLAALLEAELAYPADPSTESDAAR